MKIALEVDAWQPNTKLVKHSAVRETDFAKELGLSQFEEMNICAVKNDSGSIDISPANSFLDSKNLMACQWNLPVI